MREPCTSDTTEPGGRQGRGVYWWTQLVAVLALGACPAHIEAIMNRLNRYDTWPMRTWRDHEVRRSMPLPLARDLPGEPAIRCGGRGDLPGGGTQGVFRGWPRVIFILEPAPTRERDASPTSFLFWILVMWQPPFYHTTLVRGTTMRSVWPSNATTMAIWEFLSTRLAFICTRLQEVAELCADNTLPYWFSPRLTPIGASWYSVLPEDLERACLILRAVAMRALEVGGVFDPFRFHVELHL